MSKSMDSINTCIKKSSLFLNGVIESRYLTINERVRQFGGHPTYARFLMFLGLGLLKRKRKYMPFDSFTKDFVSIPKEIEGHKIVKDYKGNYFIEHFYVLYKLRFG